MPETLLDKTHAGPGEAAARRGVVVTALVALFWSLVYGLAERRERRR
jgi:hypothetical protein